MCTGREELGNLLIIINLLFSFVCKNSNNKIDLLKKMRISQAETTESQVASGGNYDSTTFPLLQVQTIVKPVHYI